MDAEMILRVLPRQEANDTNPSSGGISPLNPLADEGIKGGERKKSENGRGDEAAGHHHGGWRRGQAEVLDPTRIIRSHLRRAPRCES